MNRLIARFRITFFLTVACLAALGTGVALGCDGNYCEPFRSDECIVVDESFQDSCCIEGYCRTCTRDVYWCMPDGGGVCALPGGAYDCGEPGDVCQ